MCGIVGYLNNGEKSEKILKEMTGKINHRGPDEAGKYIDDVVSLGFRRLSIIDLAKGNQPIYNEDNSLVLIMF